MDALKAALPFIVILALFWFLIIRPTQKRQRALTTMRHALTVGDEVMLSSGFFGRVVALGDDRVDLQLARGVVVQVALGAIASRETAAPGTAVDDRPDDGTTGTTDGTDREA